MADKKFDFLNKIGLGNAWTNIKNYISSFTYSKSELNTKLDGKANSSDLNNYLPKSGGQLSGRLINRNVNDDFLALGGGATDGSFLFLYGKDLADGAFELRANNGSVIKHFIGGVDGTLTWDGKNIDVIEEQGDGYIRYSNGLQICWETLHLQNLVQNVNYGFAHYFPRPFINAPSVTENYSSAYVTETIIGADTIDNIHCNFWIKNTNSSLSNFDICYIAIGRWK